MHFIGEENIVTYVDFDCGITLYPETPTQLGQTNRERNYISRSCEKPHLGSFDEQNTSNIFLSPYILWDMVTAALMSLNHTSMSNQYPQPTTHHPRTDSYPVFSLLRTMDSKRKVLSVSFAFFQKNYLQDGRLNETVPKVEQLSDLRMPGAMDGIPPVVMNCNYFQVQLLVSLV